MTGKSASAERAANKERDYTAYADKPPTDLQKRFSDWIVEKTGYEPEDMDSFSEGVRLATALRMAFQASPENQEALANRREEVSAAKQAKADKPKGKAKAAKVAKVTKDTEDDADVDAEESEEDDAPVARKQAPRRRKAAEPEPEVAESEDDAEDDGDAPF